MDTEVEAKNSPFQFLKMSEGGRWKREKRGQAEIERRKKEKKKKKKSLESAVNLQGEGGQH